jgi:acyl dehydratase
MVHFGSARMSNYDVGQELAPQSFTINRALLVGYANASGDQNPIHQNEAFAQSVGLENVIAHGMFTMALAGRYVSAIAGSAAVKEFSARFLKPVVVPAGVDVELMVSGKVVEILDSAIKIEITAMCGDIKVLGMSKAVVEVK